MRRGWVAVAVAFGFAGCIFDMDVDLGSFRSGGAFQETVVRGDDGPKIALLEVSGVITDSPRSGAFSLGTLPSPIAELREALERAGADDEVAALVLRIESPGGTVSASETLYHEVSRWKERSQRPVVAYFNGLATSGAYYTAMAADEILAHPTAVTGSIGVVMSGFNFAGLMERFGVSAQTFTSGPYKDSGSPFRKMRPDEQEYLQEVIDDFYERFVEVVDLGRPGLERAGVVALADGRIYTARQALNAGLVDEIGYLEDAIDRAREAAHIQGEVRVVAYHRSGSPHDNIYSRTSTPEPAVAIDLLPRGLDLPAGFYYLWLPGIGD